jgi:hypothetical protein
MIRGDNDTVMEYNFKKISLIECPLNIFMSKIPDELNINQSIKLLQDLWMLTLKIDHVNNCEQYECISSLIPSRELFFTLLLS